MRVVTFGLTLLMLAACGGNPVRSFAAPAPAGALDYSLRTMAGLGYVPIRGGISDGYITFERAYTVGMVRRQTQRDHVTVTGAGDQLRITAVGVNQKNEQIKPSDAAIGHAEAIMSGCGNPVQ